MSNPLQHARGTTVHSAMHGARDPGLVRSAVHGTRDPGHVRSAVHGPGEPGTVHSAMHETMPVVVHSACIRYCMTQFYAEGALS